MSITQFKFDYEPKIKGRGFLPNPVAKYGIPAYADTASYPKVEGTSAHDDWWDEQIDRCINGYITGGTFIPGRYYYYLNFCKISTVGRGYHYPDFVDIDLDFFLLVEEAKRTHRGIISFKTRRKGVSEKAAKGVICHGMTFRAEKYTAGIAAGVDTYTEDFSKKVKENNMNMPPELRMHYLLANDKEYDAGWKNGKTGEPEGSRNILHMATMFSNPNVFKGKLLDDAIFEEAGEFKSLGAGYSATKACFEIAGRMVGTPYVYGTSGGINSQSKDFDDLWEDAEANYLIKLLVPGVRMFIGTFVGSHDVNEKNEVVVPDRCPNIFKMAKEQNLSYEQVLGCEDVEAALGEILTIRKHLSGAKNRKAYFEHFRDLGLNEKEMRLRFSGNNFDVDAIAEQRLRLSTKTSLPYNRYTLEWKRNEKGEILMPLQVEPVLIGDKQMTRELEDNVVYIRHMPIKGYNNIHCAGCDSYDQDKSDTSKSLGAFVIIARKGHPLKDNHGNSLSHKRVPLLLIRNRPRRKETFYENCLKASVMYGLNGATLIDAWKPMIIKFYKENGGTRYLGARPLGFEAEDSKQQHDYGVLVTANVRSKPQMLSLIESWVLDELDTCDFEQIVEGLSQYDVAQKDSDWDEIDALGIALIQDSSMQRKRVSKKDADDEEDAFQYPDWKYIGGKLVDVSAHKSENNKPIQDQFLRMLENGEFNE